jgi:hypothetical protein
MKRISAFLGVAKFDVLFRVLVVIADEAAIGTGSEFKPARGS